MPHAKGNIACHKHLVHTIIEQNGKENDVMLSSQGSPMNMHQTIYDTKDL